MAGTTEPYKVVCHTTMVESSTRQGSITTNNLILFIVMTLRKTINVSFIKEPFSMENPMVWVLCSFSIKETNTITLWRVSSRNPSSMEMVIGFTTKMVKLTKSKWVNLSTVFPIIRLL